MHNNTYQPPANFPPSFPQQQGPQSKYPQLPPISYGQAGMSPGQVGVNPEIAHKRILLKSDLQGNDATLNGVFGWTTRIWFSLVILVGVYYIYFVVKELLNDYRCSQLTSLGYHLNPGYPIFISFWVWFIVQSYLTISNVGKKDAVRARRLWISIICFAIFYLFFVVGILGLNFYGLALFFLMILYLIPVIGSLILTGVLKSELERREEIIRKLAALSVTNP